MASLIGIILVTCLYIDALFPEPWRCDVQGAELLSRPAAQTPQCITPISHNAPFCNRNVHVCTFLLQNGALWDISVMHCGICEMGLISQKIERNTRAWIVHSRNMHQIHALLCFVVNWNRNVKLITFSSWFSWLAALKVLNMKTSGTASSENFARMTFPFRCLIHYRNNMDEWKTTFNTESTGGRLNKKRTSNRYRDSHHNNRTLHTGKDSLYIETGPTLLLTSMYMV